MRIGLNAKWLKSQLSISSPDWDEHITVASALQEAEGGGGGHETWTNVKTNIRLSFMWQRLLGMLARFAARKLWRRKGSKILVENSLQLLWDSGRGWGSKGPDPDWARRAASDCPSPSAIIEDPAYIFSLGFELRQGGASPHDFRARCLRDFALRGRFPFLNHSRMPGQLCAWPEGVTSLQNAQRHAAILPVSS